MAKPEPMKNEDKITLNYSAIRMIADAMNYAEEHGNEQVKSFVHQKRVALIAILKKNELVDNKILSILV